MHNRAGVVEPDAFADSVRTAAPAGVDQPDLGAMRSKKIAQHRRVLRWVPDEEGRSETSAERRLWLLYATLRSGNLRCVAGEEIIHRLLRRQRRDWRQDAECIGR